MKSSKYLKPVQKTLIQDTVANIERKLGSFKDKPDTLVDAENLVADLKALAYLCESAANRIALLTRAVDQ